VKHPPTREYAEAHEPRAASSFAQGAANAFDGSPRQLQQSWHLAQLQVSHSIALGPAQRKGRVALDKIEDPEKKKRLEEAIAKARDERIAAKQQARLAWLGTADGSKDDDYNTAIEKARGDYGRKLWELKSTEGLKAEQFPTGRDYYGTESGGIFKRPDNGKEYVEDANGVFVPRHVRRELNKFDLPKIQGGLGLASTGQSVHGKNVDTGRKYGDTAKTGTALNVADREFLQQSWGGGANQFAISHTATHYPILSNDHHNFGAVGPKDQVTDAHGRIATDLSKIAKTERHAQWKLAPEDQGGHKIRRGAESFTEPWMANRRDKVVTSGYRNAEVVTSGVPQNSVADTQLGWEATDATGKGLSPAGEWYRALRRDKEKKVVVPDPVKKDKT
jgi:hypothetical protein